MAKATATTGTDGQVLHTRTSGDSTESQVVVIGTDGSDTVLDPSTLATQTTLAAILAKLIASPATEATLASVLTSVDGLEAKDYATQTTLAAILAAVDGLEGFTDGLETLLGTTNTNTTGLATQTTLAAILAKIIAAPATEAKQDTGNTSLATVATNTGKPGDQATTLTNGRKVSTSVGTAVALRASLSCKWVTVTALHTNTTRVAVGASGVLATVGSETGVPLAAGESVTIPVDNAASVFVDVLTSGEGVSFVVGA